MFYRWTQRYVSRRLHNLPNMEKRRVLWINIGFCVIKIRRSSKEWKEIGTSASLAGHCYNADDRIIKVITSLRMACGMNVFITRFWSMLFFILCALMQNQAQRVVWEGIKIIYRFPIRTNHTHRCRFAEVQTRWKGFSLVSLPLRHFQTAGACTRGDTRGSSHLELWV